MWKKYSFSLLAVLCLVSSVGYGQSADSVAGKLASFPSRWFGRIQSRAASLDQQMTRSTEKYLQRLTKKEDQLRKRLFRQDSAAALRIFGKNPLDYTALLAKLQNSNGPATGVPATTGGVYVPYLDSVKTSIKYLQQNKNLLNDGAQYESAMNSSLAQVSQLQNKMQVTEAIRQQISQHKA
ncbi:MAG TPA: hypothetical protein VGM30_04780, partial [Puia sp.]